MKLKTGWLENRRLRAALRRVDGADERRDIDRFKKWVRVGIAMLVFLICFSLIAQLTIRYLVLLGVKIDL